MRPEPRAVLWDFDGTLVDTEPLWGEVEAEIYAEHGLDVAELDLKRMVGESATATATMMADVIGGGLTPEQLFDLLHERVCARLRAGDLPWLPGARELLAELRAAGVRCALVTSSNRVVMEAVAEALPDGFEFIIDGDDVTRSKPDPEPYHLALSRLGLTADDVIILEDSPPGTAAASAVGAVVLAVPREVPVGDAPRRRIRPEGLAGMTWAGLCEIWSEERAA